MMKKRFLKVTAFFVTLVALSVETVMAALPTAATDAVTTVQTDALAMVDAVWPYVAAITVAFVIYRIFRRAINSGG